MTSPQFNGSGAKAGTAMSFSLPASKEFTDRFKLADLRPVKLGEYYSDAFGNILRWSFLYAGPWSYIYAKREVPTKTVKTIAAHPGYEYVGYRQVKPGESFIGTMTGCAVVWLPKMPSETFQHVIKPIVANPAATACTTGTVGTGKVSSKKDYGLLETRVLGLHSSYLDSLYFNRHCFVLCYPPLTDFPAVKVEPALKTKPEVNKYGKPYSEVTIPAGYKNMGVRFPREGEHYLGVNREVYTSTTHSWRAEHGERIILGYDNCYGTYLDKLEIPKGYALKGGSITSSFGLVEREGLYLGTSNIGVIYAWFQWGKAQGNVLRLEKIAPTKRKILIVEYDVTDLDEVDLLAKRLDDAYNAVTFLWKDVPYSGVKSRVEER